MHVHECVLLLTTAEHLQTESRGAGVCGQRQGIDSQTRDGKHLWEDCRHRRVTVVVPLKQLQ